MTTIQANRMLSGSFAQLWIDGDPVAEAEQIQLTIQFQRTDVQIGMDIDSKITGFRGEGQLKLRQVFSRFFEIVEQAKAGSDLRITITTALKDPDSFGGQEERYSVADVALTELPLVNYATGKINEQVIKFRFLPGQMRKLSGIDESQVQ